MLTPVEINIEEETKTYRTYKLDLNNKRIVGFVDGKESVEQFIAKVLLTERYAYNIYSSDYGTEFEKYIGNSFGYIKADIKNNIEDALKIDDRIQKIKKIEINKKNKDTATIDIAVETTEGESNMSMEVII